MDNFLFFTFPTTSAHAFHWSFLGPIKCFHGAPMFQVVGVVYLTQHQPDRIDTYGAVGGILLS